MWLLLWLAVSLALPGQQSTAPPSAPARIEQAPAPSSKIWIGRYTEFEEFLRTVQIVRTQNPKVGVTGGTRHAFFPPGGLAAGGALRNLPSGPREGYWESHKSEVAAYRLDRMLELDMVPPTVERRIDGDMVSLQLWVENTMMFSEVQAQKLHAPDPVRWNSQLHRMQVFDDLVGNIDENATNMLFDRAWNFIKIDHSRCFTDTARLPFDIEKTIKQIDRPFFERVKALDRKAVEPQIAEFLDASGAMAALFRRRDDIVKKFEALAKKNGESAVFVPWSGDR